MKKQVQKGFTLIELMIVVAIIGILASIALPAYQDYIARGQAAESVVLLDGARTTLEDYAGTEGAFPDGATAGQTLATLGINAAGTYGTLGEPSTPALGITYTFKASGVNSNLQGKKVEYTRTAAGVWSCNATTSSTPLAKKYAPKGCS